MPRTTTKRSFQDLNLGEQDAYIADSERLLDELDPAPIAEADRLGELRAITELVDQIADNERRLTGAVTEARRLGRSWADIARALGVTRQSAHAKYAPSIE